MSALDILLNGYKLIQASGVPVTPRPVLNFLGGTVADNPANGSTDVTAGGGGSFGGFTLQAANAGNTPLQAVANAIVFCDTTSVPIDVLPPGAGTVPLGTMLAVVDSGVNSQNNTISVGSVSGGQIEEVGAAGVFGTSSQIVTSSQGIIWVWGPVTGAINGWKIVASWP